MVYLRRLFFSVIEGHKVSKFKKCSKTEGSYFQFDLNALLQHFGH